MRAVRATRYVTPLREGGSLPAIVEADDDGLYVLKFRGAGQGPKALVAEAIAGELARAAGLRVPEIVLVDVDAALGRNEADPEIRELLRASVGVNLGLDFLPGSAGFDPVVGPPPAAEEASAVVWFDAFTHNIDRTVRNTNLLVWHRQLWLIDHGAALWFHHAWEGAAALVRSPFPRVREHVLLPFADGVARAGARLRPRLGGEALRAAVEAVPEAWLAGEPRFADAPAHRAAYVDHLAARLAASAAFEEEAERARAELV